MQKGKRLGERKTDPVADRGMAQIIIKNDVPPLGDGAQKSQVGVISGIKDQACGCIMEGSQLFFRLFDKGIVAGQEAGAAAAMMGRAGRPGLFDEEIRGDAEVIIGTKVSMSIW